MINCESTSASTHAVETARPGSARRVAKSRPATAGVARSAARVPPSADPIESPSRGAVEHACGLLRNAVVAGTARFGSSAAVTDAISDVLRNGHGAPADSVPFLLEALAVLTRAFGEACVCAEPHHREPHPVPACSDAAVMTGPWPQHVEGRQLVETLVSSRERALKDLSFAKTQLMAAREELGAEKAEVRRLRHDIGECKDIIMLARLRLPPAPRPSSTAACALPMASGDATAAAASAGPITMRGVMEQARQVLRPVVLMEVARGDVLLARRAPEAPKDRCVAGVAETSAVDTLSPDDQLLATLREAAAVWQHRRRVGSVALGGPKSSATATSEDAAAATLVPDSAAGALHRLQDAVIASLEREVAVLRRERDENLKESQSQLARTLAELEDAQCRIDESSVEWDAKQRELNRLRTLMRFSQLKRDSDKLHETYKRVDDLEGRLRKFQQAACRETIDRQELRRLRMLEAHCRAAFVRVVNDGGGGGGGGCSRVVVAVPNARARDSADRTGSPTAVDASDGSAAAGVPLLHWLREAIPPHLAGVAPSQAHGGDAPEGARRENAAAAAAAEAEASSSVDAQLLGEAPPGPASAPSPPPATRGHADAPTLSSAAAAEPATAQAAEEETSMATITQRMREYLERKKRPPPPPPPVSQAATGGGGAAREQRPLRPLSAATPQHRRRMTGATPLTTTPGAGSRGSFGAASSVQEKRPLRPRTAGTTRGAATSTGPMAPRSFAFIGGRMIPVYQ